MSGDRFTVRMRVAVEADPRYCRIDACYSRRVEPEKQRLSLSDHADKILLDLQGRIHKMDRDESFQQMLLRKIDDRGMSDAHCYRKALIKKECFQKSEAISAISPANRLR